MEIEKNRVIRVAVVGAGLIGKERIKAVDVITKRGRGIQLVGIHDPYSTDISEISRQAKVKVVDRLEQIVEMNPDCVVVAAPHDTAPQIASELLDNSLRVLMEKPMGRNVEEAKALVGHCKYDGQLALGFNYRFFQGINRLISDSLSGVFGELVSVNLLLGHGGAPKMELGWKFDPIKAGGGCLIDPGIHLLDLVRLLFQSKPVVKSALGWKGFWKTGIEEESHILMEANNAVINMQVSVVRWRSTFRMEINGTDGYGVVTGRGRSYGVQEYRTGKRWGWMKGKSQTESEHVVLVSSGEEVFADEMDALLFDKCDSKIHPCSSSEGLQNMILLEECLHALELVNAHNEKKE